MILKPGGTFTFQAFVTTAAGALVDADSTPTATVTRNGTDDGSVSVTITHPSTGRYVATATVPIGYAAGDVVNVALFYSVSSVATAKAIGTFAVDTARISEVKTELDTAKTEIDAIKAQTDKLVFDGSNFVKSAAQNLPALPTNFSSLVISGAGLVKLDLTQAVPMSNTAQTLGDCLNSSRAQGFGQWKLQGTSLQLFGGDNTTVVRQFTLDSATSPTQRL